MEMLRSSDKIIEISKPEKQAEIYLPSEQSANVLFNFMRDLKYLKMILLNKAIIPRYYEETVDHLGIKDLSKISFPMTCFCDIHLQKLIPHVQFYGCYGIGLEKKWGLNKGIQPIHYINKNSQFKNDFSYVFSNSLEKINDDNEQLSEYSNYLLTNLLFMKPLDGKMYRDKSYVSRNFHDEREWRYIPDMSKQDDLPLLVPQSELNPTAYNSYSEGIRKREELWLKFDYKFIRYLIVKDGTDRTDLISFILEKIDANSKDKNLLISKIIVFDEIREDW